MMIINSKETLDWGWDTHDKWLKRSGFTPEEKDAILKGITYLRQLLGEAWLNSAWQQNHPLAHTIFNLAPHSQFYAANLGTMLKKFESFPGFSTLRGRLANVEEFHGVAAELEVAYKISKTGFNIALYPVLGNRKADLKIVIGETEIFLEVAIIGNSSEEREASELNWQILNSLAPSFRVKQLLHAVEVHKKLSKATYRELINQMLTAGQAADKEKCVKVVEEQTAFECIVAPSEKIEEFRNECESRKISGSIAGPPITTDETKRAIRALKEEFKHFEQLPQNFPVILVIYCPSFTIRLGDIHLWKEFAAEIEETVYDFANLVFAAFMWSYVNLEDSSPVELDWKNHKFVQINSQGVLTNTIVIWNRHCCVKLEEKLTDNLINSLAS